MEKVRQDPGKAWALYNTDVIIQRNGRVKNEG